MILLILIDLSDYYKKKQSLPHGTQGYQETDIFYLLHKINGVHFELPYGLMFIHFVSR